MARYGGAVLLLLGFTLPARTAEPLAPAPPPPTADETRALMKRLARFVFEHHLKQDSHSPQRGMVYEYLDFPRRDQPDHFIQGEALDTMHDGAWLASALVNAYRATDDPFYKEFLTRWQLPFYCQMLNHGDSLFSPTPDDARPGAPKFDREHALQAGEKGFVPYWWDDGGSVSLERRRDRNPLGPFPCTDHLKDKPNPRFLLDGYSHGSSNHLAQDLAVMLQQAWLALWESADETDRRLMVDVAEAARNLQKCRMRHHGHIPMCDAAAALATGDAGLMKRVPAQEGAALWNPDNHYSRALSDPPPGRRMPFPGFADDQEYRYYYGLARGGGRLPRALAFKTVYDALTEPLLYRLYCDDAEPPPGVNRFDLHPYYAVDGKPEDYRSDRKGPGGGPRPAGSRMGPQNMVCCGRALQILHAYPGIWEERCRRDFAKDLRVYIDDLPPGARLKPAPWAAVRLGGVPLELCGTRTAMRVRGEVGQGEVSFKLFGHAGGKGAHAAVTVIREGPVRAVNDHGEELRVRSAVEPRPGGFRFEVEIPYTAAKGQRPWANGIEHGRYSVRAGDGLRNFYLASSEEQVQARLEYELAGGLRTWEAVFAKQGYVPTSLGAGPEWDDLSDAGGYAHLISAAAQWLIYQQGKSDWELARVPSVGGSRPGVNRPGGRSGRL